MIYSIPRKLVVCLLNVFLVLFHSELVFVFALINTQSSCLVFSSCVENAQISDAVNLNDAFMCVLLLCGVYLFLRRVSSFSFGTLEQKNESITPNLTF